jgi:hypothetical protein
MVAQELDHLVSTALLPWSYQGNGGHEITRLLASISLTPPPCDHKVLGLGFWRRGLRKKWGLTEKARRSV